MNPALAIAGVVPAATLEPRNRSELTAIVRELHAAGKTFAFVGGGTELELGNPPRALDAVVSMTALNRILEYSPEDQTVTVEAGVRLATLDAALAEHGQMLPIDTGDRAHATVGGAIATNAFGARRHRYGSIKDLIVGIEIVRPDGVTAHGGGKVVKNVAGFDLPKLMVGSLGTLAGIASATFRVFPQPALTQTALVHAAPDGALLRAVAADRALEPVAVVHYPVLDGIAFTFGGSAAAVAAQLERLAAHGAPVEILDAAAVERCAALEAAVRTSGEWRWTSRHNAATSTRSVALALEVGYPTLGVLLGSADDGAPLDALIEARGSSLVFRAMPARARARVDAWGTPPPSFPLMRALKANFDPQGLCNPGRYVGGL
ncbi:MAG TPA: FAD-binding oxidoreductase [Candidatus Lustribacter sp.]|nr:FAD-binding oxidoreductase [Candidatus Lustribacter sp.]